MLIALPVCVTWFPVMQTPAASTNAWTTPAAPVTDMKPHQSSSYTPTQNSSSQAICSSGFDQYAPARTVGEYTWQDSRYSSKSVAQRDIDQDYQPISIINSSSSMSNGRDWSHDVKPNVRELNADMSARAYSQRAPDPYMRQQQQQQQQQYSSMGQPHPTAAAATTPMRGHVKQESVLASSNGQSSYDVQGILAEREAMQQEIARLRWAAGQSSVIPPADTRIGGRSDHAGVCLMVSLLLVIAVCCVYVTTGHDALLACWIQLVKVMSRCVMSDGTGRNGPQGYSHSGANGQHHRTDGY